MDIATIVGTLLGFMVVVGAIIAGGGASSFVHIPSLGITVSVNTNTNINNHDVSAMLYFSH